MQDVDFQLSPRLEQRCGTRRDANLAERHGVREATSLGAIRNGPTVLAWNNGAGNACVLFRGARSADQDGAKSSQQAKIGTNLEGTSYGLPTLTTHPGLVFFHLPHPRLR